MRRSWRQPRPRHSEAPDVTPRGARGPADAAINRNTTVLVVDNNAGHRAVAHAVLERESYRVVLAAGGDEAIAATLAERPDCILMDIRMPDLDGIAACEQIRAMAGGAAIAVVFVTAHGDAEAIERALAGRGDDFITRPFLPGELIVRVQTALRSRRLATERNELVAQLEHQRDHLQRVELQKEQLVAFLVHDMRNPVTAIDFLAQLVQRSPDDARRSLGAATKIRCETGALSRMITNLLDIARAEAGQLAPIIQAIDAVALVNRVRDELYPRACEAGIEIDTDVVVPVFHADAELISRVLANLIENAIRHAPRGSQVRVAVAPSAEGIELRVADAGPGVAQDMRQVVFERFQTGAGGAGRTNHGLGLAFCKLAVEAHSGQIWIEDGRPGAVFCVRLVDVERRN